MCDDLRFEPVTDTLPPGFAALHKESLAEGHILLTRLVEALASGAERYDGVTAHFLAVTSGGALIALGGIAPDQYLADPSVGRLRHVYVARAHRGSGVGAALVSELLRLRAGFAASACAPSRLRQRLSTSGSASRPSATRMQHTCCISTVVPRKGDLLHTPATSLPSRRHCLTGRERPLRQCAGEEPGRGQGNRTSRWRAVGGRRGVSRHSISGAQIRAICA